ncbi:sodium:proton antiporter NhaD [bacterium]|nr:sodium:proton antiporter NhaD [bacterium]
MTIFIILTFVIGYIFITLEHRYHLHKAITAAALGAFLWIVIALGGGEVEHATEIIGAEIFGLIIFLLAAMTLVEILIHYRFFDFIRSKILKLGLDDYRQLWVIGIISFFLSAVIDNLTATLVMLAVATRFFKGQNLLIAAAGIVIAANAGGAWSPIGDITTIMLWIAEKFTVGEIIAWGFFPSAAIFAVSMFFLGRGIKRDTRDAIEEKITLSRSEWIIISLALLSFPLPVMVHSIGLQPYFGLVFGLGIVGIAIAITRGLLQKKMQSLHHDEAATLVASASPETHLTADIEKNLARTDIAALLFFAGILLAVGALGHIGVLDSISHALLGADPGLSRFFVGNAVLGIFSAIVDNIPLTAAAMEIIKVTDPAIWVLLALAVGTGGSLLVIGSAAGVVAMGKVKDLTFFKYVSIATLPALFGYAAGLGVWLVQYIIFR